MRRLLLPGALVFAVLAAAAVLWPSWSDRARDPHRARSRAPEPSGAPRAGGAATAEAPDGTRATGAEDSGSARVRGVITGPQGVLWGARVVAYRSGTGNVEAESHTNPEGEFGMDVEPDVAFDLSVEPADLTGLLPWRLAGVTVAAGQELQQDVALRPGGIVRGRLLDENGEPLSGIVLRAVPEDLSADATGSARLTKSQKDGAFAFKGLAPGRYALDVHDTSWMFPTPVSVLADGRDVDLVVVPGVQIDLHVKDIETGDPVPAFTVRARSGDLLLLESPGRDGALSARIRWPGQLSPRERLEALRRVSLDVGAPGFLPIERGNSPGQVAWMVPVRNRNTTIRVSFDDGDPYFGDLRVTVKSKATGGVTFVPFERDPKKAEFRGAIPWGDWEVTITPSGVYGTDRYLADARTGADLEASLDVTLPGGGTVVFSAPPGIDRAIAYLARVEEETRVLGNGTSFAMRGSGAERSFAVPREGARVAGIPPGTYRIGIARSVEVSPGRFSVVTHWAREITIDAKSIEEITLPE